MSEEPEIKKKLTLAELKDHIRNELVFDRGRFADQFPVFDFADAMARLVDGFNRLTSPDKMGQACSEVMSAYMMMCATETKATIASVVGGENKAEQLLQHENVHRIIPRIMERVGGCVPGRDVSGVDVSDILLEEGFE